MTDFESADAQLLPGFERKLLNLGEGNIRVLVGGSGPPLLMLHGDPQTHLCWHRMAPRLAADYTVVLSDLRGRGESHKPGPTEDHAAYAKRAMAAEQLAVMSALGFENFALVGHDRGARVATRLAQDHPDRVNCLCVMDIVPAEDLYSRTTAAVAQEYFYFFFLTQPSPRPERWIAGDREGFLRDLLLGLGSSGSPYDPVALDLYLASAGEDASIAAMCECFRAGITRDRLDDRAELVGGEKIACPTLVMWGKNGVMGRHFDVPAIWQRWVEAPQFAALPCGHFIPEEAPDEAGDRLAEFLKAA